MLHLWPLDPDATYLNHGTVGVTRQVLGAQQRLRDRYRTPSVAVSAVRAWTFAGEQRAEPILMRQAAAEVAACVGANADDLVFIDNTTARVTAMMQLS